MIKQIQINYGDKIIISNNNLDIKKIDEIIKILNENEYDIYYKSRKAKSSEDAEIYEGVSKTMLQIMNVIFKTIDTLQNEKEQVTIYELDNIVKNRLHDVAKDFQVTFSTCSDKCTRKIGLRTRIEFSELLYEFIYKKNSKLKDVLIDNSCNDNDIKYINEKLKR